jgi:pantothenate kinase-related protein Tda10
MPIVHIDLKISSKTGKGVHNTAAHKILNDFLAAYQAYMQPVYPLMDLSSVNINNFNV